MNQNELHQFEHIMTHSPSFDHLFGETTYTATYFRIIRSSESNYVIRWIFETLVDRSNTTNHFHLFLEPWLQVNFDYSNPRVVPVLCCRRQLPEFVIYSSLNMQSVQDLPDCRTRISCDDMKFNFNLKR